MMFRQKRALIVIGGFLAAMIVGIAYAQQRVVVVPLAGDDAAPGIADFDGGDLSVVLSTTSTVYRTVTINAPIAGKVIVNASGNIFSPLVQALMSGRCSISTDSSVDSDAIANVRISDAGRFDSHPFGLTRGFDVPAGNFTVNLVCNKIFSGEATLQDPYLTAMYFPN